MKFNTIIMQYNGQITDSGETTSEHVRKTAVGRQLIQGFDLMLNECLPDILHGVAKADFSFLDDQSGLFAWQQSEPFSAMATFFIGGSLKFTWFFLTGIDIESDKIVVQATITFLRSMARMAGQEHALQLPAERPLALCRSMATFAYRGSTANRGQLRRVPCDCVLRENRPTSTQEVRHCSGNSQIIRGSGTFLGKIDPRIGV